MQVQVLPAMSLHIEAYCGEYDINLGNRALDSLVLTLTSRQQCVSICPCGEMVDTLVLGTSLRVGVRVPPWAPFSFAALAQLDQSTTLRTLGSWVRILQAVPEYS